MSMKDLSDDLHKKRDEARYHGHFLAEKDQAEYFDGCAKVVDEHIDDDHECDHSECPEDFSNVHQHLADELMKLVDDLQDKKLKVTRTELSERVGKLRIYLVERTDAT